MSYERARQSVARWRRSLSRALLPNPCLGCGADIEGAGDIGLCAACTGRLEPSKPSDCRGCGRGIEGRVSQVPRCGACRKNPPPWDRFLWVWLYRSPLDAVIAGMKFRRLDYLATRLGQTMARQLRSALPPADAVTPVPLHWARHLSRGYDQAELMAAALASELGLPLRRALRRRRRTPPQSDRDRIKRQQNLRAAFEARHELGGARILLVDDVMTTGATLEAATRALKLAGATSVTAVTVARTPHPNEPGPRNLS